MLALQKAHDRVWDTFKNLDEAWTNKTSRQQWLQLPVEAVQRVLDNGELVATSENVVYIVLASWISSQIKYVWGLCLQGGTASHASIPKGHASGSVC